MTEFMDRQIRLQRAGQKEYTEEEVRLIIEGAIQEEREACAKVCDELVLEHPGRADLTAKQCATAIRARGQDD